MWHKTTKNLMREILHCFPLCSLITFTISGSRLKPTLKQLRWTFWTFKFTTSHRFLLALFLFKVFNIKRNDFKVAQVQRLQESNNISLLHREACIRAQSCRNMCWAAACDRFSIELTLNTYAYVFTLHKTRPFTTSRVTSASQ